MDANQEFKIAIERQVKKAFDNDEIIIEMILNNSKDKKQHEVGRGLFLLQSEIVSNIIKYFFIKE